MFDKNNSIPKKAYVIQDGGVFYIYNNSDRENLVTTREAPFKVTDYDMDAAAKARNWLANGEAFETELHWH